MKLSRSGSFSPAEIGNPDYSKPPQLGGGTISAQASKIPADDQVITTHGIKHLIMNISNVSSAISAFQPAAPVKTAPKQRADNDGDSDDRAGAVLSAPAQSESAEGGKLNVLA